MATFLGSGTGTFTGKSTTQAAASPYMVLADFNHDGKLDFATAANQIVLGNGDGTFQAPMPIVSNPPGGGFSNIAAGDINNDGWPDLVLTNNNIPYSDLYVLLNNHNGGFTQIPATFGNSTTEATLADLNGDGYLDLVLNTSVYLGNGTGSFTFEATLSDPLGIDFPLPSIVADVNGDGIPDILAIGAGTVTVYVGLGNATYQAPLFFGAGPSPGSLFPANLHGQKASKGLPDLVAPDNSGGVEVLINQTK